MEQTLFKSHPPFHVAFYIVFTKIKIYGGKAKNDFLFQIPTRLYFGKGEEPMVGKRIREYGGSRVLLHYGGGSIQKTGLYDNVLRYLKDEMCIRDRSILARRRFFLSIARDTPQAAITEAMLVKSQTFASTVKGL